MRTLALCLMLLLLAAAPTTAQVLRGRIADASSGLPLKAVDIALLNDQGKPYIRAVTDSAGWFQLVPRRRGSYRLQASLIGYATFTSEPLPLIAPEIIQVAITLSTSVLPLQPLVIVARRTGRMADFERRRVSAASGYFLTQDDIDRHPVMNASSLLRMVPGVTLRDAGSFGDQIILMRGSVNYCRANVFVDGMYLPDGDVDAFLTPDWIGAVEIYPRSSLVPFEFMRHNDCGAVAFWTREPGGGSHWSWKKLGLGLGLFLGILLMSR